MGDIRLKKHPFEYGGKAYELSANMNVLADLQELHDGNLNAVLLKDKTARDRFLEETNDAGVMTRPVWQLMNRLPMFKNCECGDLSHAKCGSR